VEIRLIRDEPEFGYDVGVVERLLETTDAGVVGILSVDHEVIGAKAHAIRGEGNICTFRAVVAIAGEGTLACGVLADSGDAEGDIDDVAIDGEGQFTDAFTVEVDADFCVGGVDQRRIRGDGDCYVEGGDLVFYGEISVLIEAQYDRPLEVAGESRLFDNYLVMSCS